MANRRRSGTRSRSPCVGGVNSFETTVETQGEEVKRHAQSNTVAYRNLFVEFIEIETTAWLVTVFVNCPYIARIHKNSSVDFPEEESSVFYAGIEFNVARLVDEIDALVVAVVGTRT